MKVQVAAARRRPYGRARSSTCAPTRIATGPRAWPRHSMRPTPATGVGLRMTSYVSADPEDGGSLKVVLAGEASRLRTGEGHVSGRGPRARWQGDPLRRTAARRRGQWRPCHSPPTWPSRPARYIVRLAVMDSAGNVGSVDHRVEARTKPIGPLTASGPVLVRVPGRRELRAAARARRRAAGRAARDPGRSPGRRWTAVRDRCELRDRRDRGRPDARHRRRAARARRQQPHGRSAGRRRHPGAAPRRLRRKGEGACRRRAPGRGPPRVLGAGDTARGHRRDRCHHGHRVDDGAGARGRARGRHRAAFHHRSGAPAEGHRHVPRPARRPSGRHLDRRCARCSRARVRSEPSLHWTFPTGWRRSRRSPHFSRA